MLDGEPVARLHVLPIAVIAFAVALFGLMIEPLGLVVTLAVLTIVTAWAGADFRFVETAGARRRPDRVLGRRVRLSARAAARALAEPLGRAMDVFANLGLGFAVALTLQNVMYCFIGVLLGTVIGVLPGIGPVTTVAMLLPISFTLAPESALILLAGIYYGAQYGGSTTAILVSIPGEASSVVTIIDGHQMALQGRAGPALGIAAIGSFFAGCFATLLIALAAPPLAAIALQFGPAEYFSLMVCGLIAAVVLAHGSLVKAIAMVVLGLLLGIAGTDVNSAVRRFDFGLTGLADGIEFVALSMAIYGLAEVAYNLEQTQRTRIVAAAVGRVWPSLADLKHCAGSILRGTGLGAILGVLPGGGALLAAFAAYTLEKNVARKPRTLRPRRHPRRGGARIRQQRRRADLVHPDADARHSGQSDHGDDDRRADGARHRAGSACHDRPARPVLGADRQHVDRQPDAGDPEPAAGRAVGASCCRCRTGCCFRRSSCSAASAPTPSTAGRSTPTSWRSSRSSATSRSSSIASRRRSFSASCSAR